MTKTLRVREREGWTTKPEADLDENRLLAEEIDDNFLALEDEKEPADATILKQAHINNTLTSTSTTAPLAANQGKTLADAAILDRLRTAREQGGTAYQTLLGLPCPPSLDLRFWGWQAETDGYPSWADFTRATIATRVNHKGLIEQVGSGELRHDYDPVTGEYLGVLIEETRTNLLTYSEDFTNAAWLKGGSSPNFVTIESDETVSPDGEETADKVVEQPAAAGTQSHPVSQAYASFASGTSYTFSVFAKAGGRAFVRLTLPSARFNSTAQSAQFSLSDGSHSVISGSPTVTQKDYGNGWWRFSITATCDSTGSGSPLVYICDTTTSAFYTGNGTSGLYIWGAQLEAGSFPTSYIPTTTATVQRAADQLSITGGAFSEFYRQGEGTVCILTTFNVQGIIFEFDSGNVANRIVLDLGSASNYLRFRTVSSSSSTTVLNTSNVCFSGVRYKICAAWSKQGSEAAVSLDGASAVGSTTSTIPTNITHLRIGGYSVTEAEINGHIRHLTYFPKRLSNAHLQLLSS